MKKTRQFFSVLLTLAMLLSLVPAMGVTASAAGTEIEAVSFTYTGYAEGENVADAVVTCKTAGVDFTYKWEYSDSGGSYSDATKLSAQFISGIKYTLWIYFKAQDGLALAELNETDVTLGGNNPEDVYTNYTIDEVKYSYGVPFSMSPLGGVTKYIVGFYTQGGKIGEESYRVERVTGTDGKLTAEQVPTPTKEHYTFDGWYTAESGGTLLSLDTVYTDSRNEYYARWVPTVDIDVTFDANGGKVNGKDTDTITIPAADKGKLASLPVPTREGYTFDGWYTAASGGTKITEATVFSEATTVYALWGAIDSVSFSYTGYAEGENVADAVVTCDTVGVDFTYKWRYSDSGGSYSDATKLSAQFISGIKYTLWIYFKAQDGLALAELNETDVTLGGNNPEDVYTNYTIDEVKYSYGVPFSMSPLGGVTKYIVGFYTQGGKIGEESYRVERVTGTDGKLTAEQVPTPTKEHYTFDGWYTAESGGTLLSLDTVYTDSRNEYYARWTENPALTGTATITGTAKFGQALTASLESGNNTGTLSYQWKRDGSDISGAMNSTYTLVKADIGSTITVEISSSEETGTLTSAATAAVKKADSPGAPTGLNGVNPTTLGGSDGKITGTTTAMEYSTDSNFASPAGTVCSGTEITGLTAGTYYVRIAETDTHFAGATATVTVPADDVPLTYTATVTPDGKTFAARTVGYSEQTAETFTITNTGTGALASLNVTLTGANADSFTLDKTGFNTNLATSGTTTFTIKPNTGLAAGTYTATVRVTATNLTTIDKTIRFTVKSSGGGGGGGGTTRYTVKFETNGGNAITSSSVTKNSVVKEPTAPAKEGFTFDGWYTDEKLTAKYDFASKVTKDFTLYAKWNENEKPVDPVDPPKPTEWENPFTDIHKNDWFYDSVKYAYENGLMKGVSNTEFAPQSDITRAMFVTVLYRIENEPQTAAAAFIDIESGSYYEKAVAWANANGIVSGISKDRFAPNDPITREQMAAIIYRYATFKGYDITTSGSAAYTDNSDISDYAKDAIIWAAEKSIMTGNTDGSFAPKANTTRAQATAVFMRMLENLK